MSQLEWIEAIQAGDTQAFGQLMQKMGPVVSNWIHRHIPSASREEVQQEAWIRIWRAMESYQHQGKLEAFLRTISARTCHDWWRRQSTRELSQAELGGDLSRSFEELMQSRDFKAFRAKEDSERFEGLLDWVFLELKPRDRMLARLVYLEDYSAREAAEILGQSAVWARVRLHRLKARLAIRIREWMLWHQ